MDLITNSTLHEQFDTLIAAASVGPDGRITPPHLMRLFQEAAMKNTVRLGLSSPDLMRKHNLSWVMRRQYLKANSWPSMNDRVTVVTAPTGFRRKLITLRDFYLLDQNGEVLVKSTSEWLLIDMGSRRLRPMPPEVMAITDNLPDPAAVMACPTAKHLAPASAPKQLHFRVPYFQLDFNNHLTNPAYPELMLEPLGKDFLSTHEATEIDIAYAHEGRYGDELSASAAPTEDGFYHALSRGEEVLCTMLTKWRPA